MGSHNKRRRWVSNQKGHTLTELMIALGIFGTIFLMVGFSGLRLLEKERYVNYERECHWIFERILYHRDQTLMVNRPEGDRIRFYQDSVHFGVYDSEKRYYRYHIIPLKESSLQGFFLGKELVFHREGTVNIGGTLTFNGKGCGKKTLVVQPGAGRIYLKNE